MKYFSILFWLALAVVAGFGYYRWVTDYNQSLDAWEPIVAECSDNGGFMNAEGVCDYNQ